MALERLQLLIEATSRDAVRGINDVEDASGRASLKQQFLTKDSNLAKTALDQVGLGGLSAGQGLTAAAVGGGALVAVGLSAFALDAADEYANLAGQVRKFQEASGASAEDSSRWVASLDDLGISVETGATAAFKLSREVGTGGEKLAEFGVEVERNKDGSANLSGTLLNVADAYNSTSDQGERAALVQAAFGRGGKELIPILQQGREGIEEFFKGAEEGRQIFSQDDLQKAREYDLAIDRLSDTFRGFKLQAGEAALPVITEISDTLATGMNVFDAAKGAIGGVGDAIGDAGLRSVPVVGQFVQMTDIVGSAAEMFGIGGDEAEDFGDKQSKLSDATSKVLDLQVQGKQGTQEYRDALAEAKGASKELSTAQRDVGEAFQTTAGKAAEAQAAIINKSNAEIAAAGSVLNLEQALDVHEEKLRAVTDAQNANALAVSAAVGANYQNVDANAAAASSTEVLSDAQRDLDMSTLSVASSAQAVLKAEGDRAVAQLGPHAEADDITRARTKAQRAAYNELMEQFPGLREQTQGYVGDLGKIPGAKGTRIDLDDDDAHRKLDRLFTRLSEIPRSISLNVQAVGDAVSERAPQLRHE